MQDVLQLTSQYGVLQYPKAGFLISVILSVFYDVSLAALVSASNFSSCS
ncbi:hypothetical protein QSI_1197 [Clostridioides difficile P28]|nr:hypothetical protein QSI_1197 [Clostridioides difficile P28]